MTSYSPAEWLEMSPPWIDWTNRNDGVPGMNISRLKHFSKSPKEFKWWCQKTWKSQPYTTVGRAAHCLVLEPGEYRNQFITCEIRRDARTQAYKDFLAAAGERTVLSKAEHFEAHKIADGVLNHPVAKDLLEEPWNLNEQRLFWTDSVTGIPCAGTPDRVTTTVMLDLKTTNSIDLRKFKSTASRFGYAAQAAFYTDGARANGYDLPDESFIIAVSSKPPYDVLVQRIGMDEMAKGRRYYGKWMGMLADCIERDEWPGAYPEVVDFESYGEPDDADLSGLGSI